MLDQQLHYDDRNGLRLLSVTGEFDLANCHSLEGFIVVALEGPNPVVVDLTQMTYLDSTVLATLVRLKKNVGSKLRIVVPKDSRVRHVFEITQLCEALCIADNLLEVSSQIPRAS